MLPPEQRLAPPEWAWHGFPLRPDGEESISLDWVAEQGLERIARAGSEGDRSLIGPVLHWAHRLKTEQGLSGDWPRAVNARTGAELGAARTKAPALLLLKVGETMQSSEFDAVVERALGVETSDLQGSRT